MLFQWKRFLEAMSSNPMFFGPFAFSAAWMKTMLDFVTGPIKAHARIATRTGNPPDIFIEQNERIEQNYAKLLYDLCSHFMKNGVYDRQKVLDVSRTSEGKALLKEYIEEFTWLEIQYNSLGLTGLKAMKELLKCILMLITEKPLEDEELPFMRKNKDGTPACSFSKYLEEIRTRLENLYRKDAFETKTFSEKATQGKIGCSPYEIVEGSKLNSVLLRHYRLPENVKPNGKVLYIATPLINRPEIFDLAKGKYSLPSMNPELNGKPVNMEILKEAGVRIFDYRGRRDPIAPADTCIASELWGQTENITITRGGLNRTIEKNMGHIFVVSKKLLAEYLEIVNEFYSSDQK